VPGVAGQVQSRLAAVVTGIGADAVFWPAQRVWSVLAEHFV
jgi:hypothetical protein